MNRSRHRSALKKNAEEPPRTATTAKIHRALLAGAIVTVAGCGVWLAVRYLPDGRPRPLVGTPPGAPDVENPIRREALALADQIVRDYPDSPEALYVRGLILNRFDSSYAAVTCWRKCLELVPEFADCYYWIGWDALRRGEYAEAIGELRRAVELECEIPDVRLKLAEALRNSGATDEAAEVLEQHVRQHPRGSEGFVQLGEANFYLGDYPQAIDAYEQALAIDPRCSYALFGLAKSHRRQGDAERSRELLEKFQQVKQEDFAAGRVEKLRYDDTGELRQGLADAYLVAARVYEVRGRSDRAEACWRQAADVDPDSTRSREKLLEHFGNQGRWEEALAVQEELCRIEPDRVSHWGDLGMLCTRLKKLALGEQAFQRVIELAPEQPDGYAALAQLYVQADNQPGKAEQLAHRAVELEPSGENYYVLSIACAENDRPEEALAAIEQALRREPAKPVYQQLRERLLQSR